MYHELGARSLPLSCCLQPFIRHVSTSNAVYFSAELKPAIETRRLSAILGNPVTVAKALENSLLAKRESDARAKVFDPAEAREKAIGDAWN